MIFSALRKTENHFFLFNIKEKVTYSVTCFFNFFFLNFQ